MTAQTLVRQKTVRSQHTTQSPMQQFPQQSAPPSTQYSLQDSFLIIGYGNELRGDDAVGAEVAHQVNSWDLPKVKAITVHQLLPELATDIIKADYVFFVDACGHKSCSLNVQVDPLSISFKRAQYPHPTAEAFTHNHSAQGLLSLTYRLYGHAPQAWMIQVPAESFGLGDALSSTAQHGVDEAVQTIERFLVNYQVPSSST